MNEVMLDLETMGNGPNAAIVAIGAVEFDRYLKTTGSSFYTVVDLKSAVALGGVMDADTVLWWMRQSTEARSAISVGESTNMIIALTSFADWLSERGYKKTLRIWGNGADFDNVILASAYRNCGLPIPWEFWNNRCYRTIKSMHKDIKMERSGTYHNALDDARSQANHLMRML